MEDFTFNLCGYLITDFYSYAISLFSFSLQISHFIFNHT